MSVQLVAFIVESLLALVAVWFALRDVRVWWAYVVAGEMVFTLGVSVLYGVIATDKWGWEPLGWYFVFGATQGIAVIMLLLCLAKTYVASVYAIAGLLAVSTGLIGGITGEYTGAGYAVLVALFGLFKISTMVHYWHHILNFRRLHGYNRIHVWQG